MDSKYQVNEEVFVVKEYKIVKCKIEKIVVSKTATEEKLEYIVSPIGVDKAKQLAFSEAYIVETLEEAKQSALANWETIYRNVKKNIETLSEKSYEEKEEETT